MRSNAIIRIVLFSVAILMLLGILIGVVAIKQLTVNLFEHHNDEFHTPIVNDNTVTKSAGDAEKIQNIEIDWVSGSITVEQDPTCSEISMTETHINDEDYRMVCTTSGSTLKIQYCKDGIKFPNFGINFDGLDSKDLVIKVPEGWVCRNLEIDTASARVQLNGLTIGEFDFDGASGECTITNCHVDTLDLDTASGDVTFDGTLNHLDCDAASANCRLTVYNNPRSIKVDSASGNLELRLPEDCGFTCSMETLSGRFTSDLETVHQNGRYVHGDGACSIHVNAMSGDISIHGHSDLCTDDNCTDPGHGHTNHH